MLPDATLAVPGSLMSLPATFAPLFTAPSSRTFCGLACGFFAHAGSGDGVRDAGRGGPYPGLEPRPGAPVLLPRPLGGSVVECAVCPQQPQPDLRRAPRCCKQICSRQRAGVYGPAVPHAGGMAHDEKNPLFSERVREQLLLQRILVLDGILDDDNGTLLATQLLTLAVEDPAADIALWIHSPGGSVPSMLAIRDVMRLVPCDVSTLALGLACSAGQFLLSAGAKSKRFALPHARILMHRGSAGIGGSAVDIEVQADDLRHTVDTVLGLIAEDTGQPVERVFDDSLHDHWYTAAEAREYGFIDEIVGSFGQVMPGRKHRIGLKGPGGSTA
jgi:ATP-dependent Clp protease, protease subunit